MLDIKFIRDNPEVVKEAVRIKGFSVDIDRLLTVDEELRECKGKVDNLRAEKNSVSREIPQLGEREREVAVERVRQVKEELAVLEQKMGDLQHIFETLMLQVPSVPLPEVPLGVGEEDNVEVRAWGDKPKFGFEMRDHLELAEMLDIVDVPRAVKFAGSRTYALKNEGVLLEHAILRFALDYLLERGFTAVSPPLLVRERAMMGTGYFPLGKEQAYYIGEDDLFLIGTSEVPLVALHQDEILSYRELPIQYAGYSYCFRREAGTYGKDTRGLYRVHQFRKVEQVVFCRDDAEEAEKIHQEILANAEGIMQAMELPYRVTLACTGEIGIGQVKKHEVEAWMPSREAYSETHSCSTLNDFQSRRLNIKFRDSDGKSRFVYTLNNTAIATPRVMIPLLENNQNEDGSVNIPAVLQPYMNGQKRLEPKGK